MIGAPPPIFCWRAADRVVTSPGMGGSLPDFDNYDLPSPGINLENFVISRNAEKSYSLARPIKRHSDSTLQRRNTKNVKEMKNNTIVAGFFRPQNYQRRRSHN